MRVLLVDDHFLFLDGLRNLLVSRDIEVVGTAGDGLEAVKKTRFFRPDLIMMDIRMPFCNGLEATRLIKAEFPDIKIVMLTTSEEETDLFEAIKSGASGYLLKSLKAEELFGLLSDLKKGEVSLSPVLSSQLLEEYKRGVGKGKDSSENYLTERQEEILTHVAQGKPYKEVGKILFISENTVKYHMGRILEKLHLDNRSQVIAYATKKGIIGETS
ncbi:MAG: response regulator transcription factor [Carboxydocellales bacterium]